MCFSFFVPSAQHVADVIGRLVHGVLCLVRRVLRAAPHRGVHHCARRHPRPRPHRSQCLK